MIGDAVELITQRRAEADLRHVGSRHDRHRHAAAGRSRSPPTSMSTTWCASTSRCSAPPASASRAASRCCCARSSSARPDLRVFLIDPHNEYGHCFDDRAQVLSPKNLRLPFWLFNFEEIVDVFFRGRPGVEEEVEILSELIPIAKVDLPADQRRRGTRRLVRNDPKSSGVTVDTPVPYRLEDLIRLIDERMGKLENRAIVGAISPPDHAHRDRAQRPALRLHVRQRQCRRRHHGGDAARRCSACRRTACR